jgi:O-antigen ligase
MTQLQNKSNFLRDTMLDKSNIALICILGMVIGFLISPAVLSISMIIYGINGLWGIHPRLWLPHKWWLLGVAWIALYTVSYAWSRDMGEFVGAQVKLPFLLLPLAFSYTPRFSQKQLQAMTLLMGVLLLGGVEYSISFLLRDRANYINGYGISHILPTPANGDHISFSIGLVLYIIWVIYARPMLETTTIKWIAATIIALLILYLHVLAAKSGLVALYLFLILWCVYLAFIRKKILGFVFLLCIPLLLFFAMRQIPTFGMRKGYVDYSVSKLKEGDRSGNYGDIGRLMSYKLALHILREHPLTGVGAGDMMTEMKKGYDQFYPQVADRDRLIPHNQFLIVAVCAGIPAMLIFAVWYFIPLTWLRRNRQSFFFFLIWLVLFVHVMIDTTLEVQMGVYLNVCYILLMREELPQFASAKEKLPGTKE